MLRLLFLFILFAALRSSAQAPTDSLTVYFFLLEDCMITQAYTDRLLEIHNQYAPQGIGFVGLFSNPVSSDSTVSAFVQKYDIPFGCAIDGNAAQARTFGVTVTPEVVLYNHHTQAILYQGRIDNLFERVGRRRQVVTSFELEAALYAVTHGKPVPIARTQAVGCFLPISKP